MDTSPAAALNAQLSLIDNAPSGPKIAAYFDFDGTIIDGYSALAYLKDQTKQRKLSRSELLQMACFSLLKEAHEEDFKHLLLAILNEWRGQTEAALQQKWQILFQREIAKLLFPETVTIIRAHQRKGHRVVVCSAAFKYQIESCAEELNISEILSTKVEMEDGRITGEIAGTPLWGNQKAIAMQNHAAANGINLDDCFCYSNGGEDVPMLNAAGTPLAVNPDKVLTAYCDDTGLAMLKCRPRRKVTFSDKLRTIASDIGMTNSFVGSVLAHLAGMPKRDTLNSLYNIGSDLGLALAGIKLNIVGEHHLWEKRPAVFIFNHQSMLDLLLGMYLVRKDCTGVVKKEARDFPGWGHFMRFADVAFVERGNTEQAKAALAPALDKLANGISIGFCPEGTRSYSDRMRKFKKGAFHIAMQAGVPIVPVVFRNAWECMQRDSLWMRSGTVDVCVHKPIDTADWTLDNMEQKIGEIEQLYQQTLNHWPAPIALSGNEVVAS